jgi:hypothetical protein
MEGKMTREECLEKAAIADAQSRDCPNPLVSCHLQILADEWRAASLRFPPSDIGNHRLEAAE